MLTKKQAEYTQTVWLHIDDVIEIGTYKHIIYLAQQLHEFKKVRLQGSKSKSTLAFSVIRSVLMSEFEQKFIFEFRGYKNKSLTSGEN